MCKISVVVPVYNVELYIRRCLDSITGQTLKDIEIILVDDGSADLSGKICDEYAKKDDRVAVIHKENGGLVSARKAGLIASKGEFIACVDADDWIESTYLEKMVAEQERSGAQLVAAGHCHEIGDSFRRIFNAIPCGVYECKQLLPKALYSGQFFEYGILPHLWNKLFDRELLLKAQMRVDENIIAGEDAAVVYPALLECGKVCVSDVCGYHYVQHPTSITKTIYTNEIGRIEVLISYLQQSFEEKGVLEVMLPQLEQYEKYLLLMRQPEFLFEKGINPFGEIPRGSRIVLYCAGVLGKRLYRYFTEKKDITVVAWVDQCYEVYREEGLPVCAPQDITEICEYDAVLIANTSYIAAESIHRYLRSLSVNGEKICWFSERFLNESLKIR